MGASPMAAEQGAAEALVWVRSRVEEGIDAAFEAAIEAGSPIALDLISKNKALSSSEKQGALIKLGHQKSVAANPAALALMEEDPSLKINGALVRLGYQKSAALREQRWRAQSQAQVLNYDEVGAALFSMVPPPLPPQEMAPQAMALASMPEMAPSMPMAPAAVAAPASIKRRGWTDGEWQHSRASWSAVRDGDAK